MKTTPESKWVWLAYSAHFICASRCAFRLGTVVGRYIVSSVGDMRIQPDGRLPSAEKPLTIGCGRTYETMVFKRGPKCDCGCGEPRINPSGEVDMLPANSAAECHKNHMKLCRKYAAMGGK